MSVEVEMKSTLSENAYDPMWIKPIRLLMREQMEFFTKGKTASQILEVVFSTLILARNAGLATVAPEEINNLTVAIKFDTGYKQIYIDGLGCVTTVGKGATRISYAHYERTYTPEQIVAELCETFEASKAGR